MSNEPIIRPLWLYLIDLLNKLNVLMFLVLVVTVGITIIAIAYCLSEWGYFEDDEAKEIKRVFKKVIVVILVVALVVVAIPTKETMYTMLIAEQITPANVQYVGESVEGCVDYMFDKVDDLIDRGDADE